MVAKPTGRRDFFWGNFDMWNAEGKAVFKTTLTSKCKKPEPWSGDVRKTLSESWKVGGQGRLVLPREELRK